MGGATGDGASVGGAVGKITIETRDFLRAAVATKQFSQQVEKDLDRVSASTKKAERGISSLASALSQLGGALGVSAGLAGAVQLGRFALEADKLATAYARQTVAAVGLAGSQAKLNDLLRVYDKATGGAIDRATALGDVTRLLAVGFADSAAELDEFARAARGISVAMGVTQDYVIGQLTLAIANQSFMRLDQIGLDAVEAKKRIDQLMASNKSLTKEMAYQQAIIGIATEKYGKLADSAEAQASGAELAAKAWKNLKLQMGESFGGPMGSAMNRLAEDVEQTGDRFADLGRDITRAMDAWERFQRSISGGVAPKGRDRNWLTGDPTGLNEWLAGHELGERPGEGLWMIDRPFRDDPRFNASGSFGRNYSRSGIGNRSGVGANIRDPFVAAAPGINEEARQVHLDWARGVNEVNTRLHADIIGAERDYGRNRAETVADYNKSVAREERDFGRMRLRAELDQLDAIADVWKSAARRESKAAEDLARAISSSRSDSDERIADARKDTNKRLAELDEDFKKDQARRQEDFRDDMLKAAGRLDAIAILELRKGRARELADAKDAHEEQRSDLQEQLDERIADENESLQKSIRQAQEAHDRQLADAREADALRLQDMKDDFAKRKAQEDEDRAIRKNDAAIDHADQLAEMDRAHAERIQQIRDNAAEERRALQDAADAELVRLGEADKATRKRVEAKEKHLEDMWDKFHKHIEDSLTPGPEPLDGANRGKRMTPMAAGGYVAHDMAAYLHAGEYVMPASAVAGGMSGSRGPISIGEISISIAGTTDMGPGELRPLVYEVLVDALEQVAGRR